MDEKKNLLEKYVNYVPDEDHNGSQGHAIVNSILSIFGSYESFNKYKLANTMTNDEAREYYLGKIKKRNNWSTEE